MSKDCNEVRVSYMPLEPTDRLVCKDCGKDFPLSMFKCFKVVKRNGRKEEESYFSQWCIHCRRHYAEQKKMKGKTRSGEGSYWERRRVVDKDPKLH